VSTRDRYFFDPRMMNPWPLNANIVVVNLEGRQLFLDPGVPFTPFGLLPWTETAVLALRLDKGGGEWLPTPLPKPADSRVEHDAALQLQSGGTLEGQVTVTFTGLEAAWRRLQERNEDDTDRRQFLEDQLRSDIPAGIDVTLTNTPDWAAWDAPLVAEYHLRVPGWAISAGQRQLMKIGLFAGAEAHMFEHAARVQPLYFSFPYQHADEVTITLPAGRSVSSTPKPRKMDMKVLAFDLDAQARVGAVHFERDVTVNMSLVESRFYGQIRDFFQSVRSGDAQQVVISPVTAAALH